MSRFVIGCSRMYRRMARAFPRDFRATCGDGLEQLGENVVPRVWQQHGAVGMMALFADLALRLPDQVPLVLDGQMEGGSDDWRSV